MSVFFKKPLLLLLLFSPQSQVIVDSCFSYLLGYVQGQRKKVSFLLTYVQIVLIYSVSFISAVEQSDSVTPMYILFIFSSIVVHPGILNIVFCAIR